MNKISSVLRQQKLLRWILLFLCFDAIYWLLILFRSFGYAISMPITELLALVCPLLAFPLCLGRPAQRHNTATLFLGLGILAFAGGQIVSGYYEMIHQSPFPSFADCVYLSGYPLISTALFLLPIGRFSKAFWMRLVLDMLIVFTTLLAVSWYFVLGPMLLQSGNSLLAKIVGTAYPCGDLLILLGLLLLWHRSTDRPLRSVILLLSIGLLATTLADCLFDMQTLQKAYDPENWFRLLWPVGYQLVGLGAFVLRRLPLQEKRATSLYIAPLWRSLLPYALLPLLACLMFYSWHIPEAPLLQDGVTIAMAAVVVLVLVRQIIAIRELRAMSLNNHVLTSLNTQLEIQATHDMLTGLPNRTLLWQRLDKVTQDGQGDTSIVALLLLDLDGFKEINDTLGHLVGDRLLQQIGPRLQRSLRDCDLVTRLGGDEFAVLLPDFGMHEAERTAQVLLNALEEPFLVEEHLLMVRGSIGVALAPEHGLDTATLLRHADVAMYIAKQQQRGYTIYAPEVDKYSTEKLSLIGALRHAIANDELVLYYQPKVALNQDRVIGVEALVRWQHPELGLVPPDAFIPLAERTGLIGPLTRWVLRQALYQCHEWDKSGLHLKIAVNLSAHMLYDANLFSLVSDLLQQYNVAPGQLTLEITENMCMENPEQACIVLGELRNLGIAIAIDDFGTGYSSLGYLKRLPLDEIKIDKTFVLGLGKEGDPTDLAIVQAVVAMARPLQCQVVAEGVEDAEAGRQLQLFGCDLAQGYYYARPMASAALETWARTSSWRTESQELSVA